MQRLVRGVFQTEVQLDNWLAADRRKRMIEEREKALLEDSE